ncbi:vWA domain-containing protein [Solicola gregarius]|uniref:VWA domain-containing protein n=1 Tax=Solicola gregarius TaxID=2908642 RepID=A0AA46TG90_9ACTN|nr:VWA domain-containing protein [Solicola gregarius]UYM03998.1 VWA domain-containing protein [Solicola gregarius]
MLQLRRGVAAFAAGLIGLAVTVTPAHADDTADDAPDDAGDYRMQLVLDSSGSMKEPAKGGTKIEVAKESLDTVVDDLPDSAQVGLRVYGAEVSDGPKACTDSQEVVSPGTGNRDELHTAVDDYKPLGETPIGYALQEAAKDLGSEGKRTIVLVSDGEPTCKPNPCKVARQLSKDGIDLRIDVVGLSVDAKTRKKLACIAKAGNGSYYDADDAESLTRSIDTVSTRAFRPFDLTGEPVDGSDRPGDAPTIETGRQYLDKLPREGDSKFYRFERRDPRSILHVGTTARTASGSLGNGVIMMLKAENSDVTCGHGTSFANSIGADRPLLAGSVSTAGEQDMSECKNADFYTLEIEGSTLDSPAQPVRDHRVRGAAARRRRRERRAPAAGRAAPLVEARAGQGVGRRRTRYQPRERPGARGRDVRPRHPDG